MTNPINNLVVFHQNTPSPTQSLNEIWLPTPPRIGEIVNVVPRGGKEFIGRVVDVAWFIPTNPVVGSIPTVKVYLDPVITGSPKVDGRVRKRRK